MIVWYWQQLQNGVINIKLILTLMFSFKDQIPLQPKGTQKVNPLPDVQQPQRLFSLPPPPFYIQASEPLNQSDIDDFRNNKQIFQAKIQKTIKQKNELQAHYNRLNDEYLKLAKQYQSLKQKYKEGEYLFREMQSENMRLYHQVEALKTKKQQKSRLNILKKRQVPIVKISVPNPKTLGQQSQKDSIYRQLKAASQQLIHMRKILQSEKQKSEHTQSFLSKNIQQLSFERDSLKNQINLLKEQNKLLKQDASRLKTPKSIDTNPMRIKSMLQNSQYEKIKFDFERLQRVHKSCDILLQSKENQILCLKDEIQKLNESIKSRNADNQRTFMRTQSKHNLNNSYVYAKETGYKETLGNTFLPQSSAKKLFDMSSEQDNNTILQQHLQLSVKQMRNIQQFTKNIVKDFIQKIDQLKNEADRANKKVQHQKFELQRVYELLRDKKTELQNCYNDLKMAGKNSRSTPTKERDIQDDYLKSILKGRRDLSS